MSWSTWGLALTGLSYLLLFVTSFALSFLPAFEGDGAQAVKDGISKPTTIAVIVVGVLLLSVSIGGYFYWFVSNQDRPGLLTFLYALTMTSFLLANISLVSSLFQVSIVKA